LLGEQLGAKTRAVLAYARDHVSSLETGGHALQDRGLILGSAAAAERVRPEQLFGRVADELRQALVRENHVAVDVNHDAFEGRRREQLEALGKLEPLLLGALARKKAVQQPFDDVL